MYTNPLQIVLVPAVIYNSTNNPYHQSNLALLIQNANGQQLNQVG